MRLPYRGECDLCGSSPAGQVVLRRVTGLVLFWRSYRFEAELCRICATVVYREAQAHNLTAGWWGVIAPLANLYALATNSNEYSAIKNRQPPTSRDPNVMTPLPGPPPYAPPLSARPGPWFGTIAALIVFAVVIGGIASEAGSTGSTSSNSPLGTCLDIDGYVVPCSDRAAYWKLVARGPNCGSAPATFTHPATDRVYCAVRN